MDETQGKFKKEIGLITLVALGVGSVIGSGIYAMPAVMAEAAGPSLIISIIISAVVVAFIAIIYAELGAAFPMTGGPYTFPRLAMGDLAGFLMGWGYFIYLFIGTAAIIDIFVAYLGFYVPGLALEGGTLTPKGIAVAIAVLWIVTLINILGVKWGGLYGLLTTVGKLIPLFIFGVIGLGFINPGNFTPLIPFGAAGATFAVTLFFWAYVGFEAVVVPCEEVKNPSRNIPIAMLLTVVITTVVYILVAAVFTGMIDWQGLGLSSHDWAGIGKLKSPLADVSAGSGLLWLAAMVTIGAAISTAGCGGNWVLLQGRMPFAMAKDGFICQHLAKVHGKFGTPHFSLVFASILTMIVMIAIPNFPSVALIASITAIIPYAAAALALPILRKTRADAQRPFRLPLALAVSFAGFVLASFLIYWGSWPWTLVGAALTFSGYPLYFIARKKHSGMRRSLWIPAYLAGMVAISLIGDPRFEFKNFTPWKPLGLVTMPYDMIVIAVFAAIIFFWGYRANVPRASGQ